MGLLQLCQHVFFFFFFIIDFESNLRLSFSIFIPNNLKFCSYHVENRLTGSIPEEIGNITTLKRLFISDNDFVGKIPGFIQNWTTIYNLEVSDLNGEASSPFPSLNNLTNLNSLVMRNYNITGELPDDFGGMKFLDMLSV
uniref:Non-specific serine/threonine protein kinase n=1 Tax=Cucumis melo TaxID=3656 RepID=A0A9I9EE17_CUCME